MTSNKSALVRLTNRLGFGQIHTATAVLPNGHLPGAHLSNVPSGADSIRT